MAAVAAEQELMRDCRVLFGTNLQVSRQFLEYLQDSGVKSAYRKKARETHPDHAVCRGDLPQAVSGDLFRAVHQAYQNLRTYLAARNQGFRFTEQTPAGTSIRSPKTNPFSSQSPRTRVYRSQGSSFSQKCSSDIGGQGHSPGRDIYYHGPLPARYLPLGHFFYYSGLICWRTVVRALIWQRNNRLRLGRISRDFGLLTEAEIMTVVEACRAGEKFGQAAVRLGLLSAAQRNLLLFQQRRLEKRFGEFFVEQGMLTRRQLASLIVAQQQHNADFDPLFSRAGFVS